MAAAKTRARARKAPETVEAAIRDRVKEFRRVPASELMDNERNWRTHPYAQRQALGELLEKVGIAGALLAYESPRNGGKLTLIDGHARKEDHDVDWPTLILDVDDEEADLLLATYDPIAGLADMDPDALTDLLNDTGAGTPGLEDLMLDMRRQAAAERGEEFEEELEDAPDDEGPAEMELLPFEHYDYVVVLCRSSYDWTQLSERLGLEQEGFTLKDGRKRKTGRGRVIESARLVELLK
jgi:hypothetical protein